MSFFYIDVEKFEIPWFKLFFFSFLIYPSKFIQKFLSNASINNLKFTLNSLCFIMKKQHTSIFFSRILVEKITRKNWLKHFFLIKQINGNYFGHHKTCQKSHTIFLITFRAGGSQIFDREGRDSRKNKNS